MGAVYQAWDAELGVMVALKTIRPESIADPAAVAAVEQRFKRELLIAREVTHKNVVRIHDLGEIDATKYITMSYVEGWSLATLLHERGRLPVPEALRIARQVASGLQAAHEAGVVHRDLKPANIMVDAGGHALILDFGIARIESGEHEDGSTVAAGPGTATHSDLMTKGTLSGTVAGTLEYMAPEQAKAGQVDQRADIYAFGLILRDLLVGLRPAKSPLEDLQERIAKGLPPLSAVDAGLPGTLEAIVTRCTQIDPAERYQTTGELCGVLNRLDDEGQVLPEPRRLTWRLVAAGVILVAGLTSGVAWLLRPPPPPVEHEPVSLVIADFRNATGDATFDRTLEPMLKIALEDAGFVTAFDRTAIRRNLGVTPPNSLDEQAAREIAVRQGLGVVVSGSLASRGGHYDVSLKAIQAVTGNVIADVRRTASDKTRVLGVATNLAGAVRKALGDETPDSDKRFAMETLSATSLDVVREYAAAAEAMSRSKFADALQSFSKTIALDSNFGLGYAGMAISSRNLDKQQDAEKYIQEAVRHLDGMTERERYRTRGLFYFLTSDYQNCVKEFGDLIAKYSADASARNNLALCSTYLRDMPRAVDEMRKVVSILPKRALYRENLALYAAYSGDVKTPDEEARVFEEPGMFALLAVAFAQLLQGQVAEATATYQGLSTIDELGVSYTASGLGDLALYEGRLSEAVALFTKGAATDLASKDPDRAANKLAALAYTQALRGRKREAAAAAEQALANSTAPKIRFLAARVFVEADRVPRGRELAAGLASSFQAEPRAYGKLIEGHIALKAGNFREAATLIAEANGLLDTWIGHFDLGRAYLEAGVFTQADSEFDRCIKRRGEVLSLFLDEEPTYGYFPQVYYYQGRVREGLKSEGFAESYRLYLGIRGQSKEDPLVADARRRAGN